MNKIILTTTIALCSTLVACAQNPKAQSSQSHNKGNPQINYSKFLKQAKELQKYRDDRRVGLATFLKMSSEKNTIILDTRSEKAYTNIHVLGARHLNFSDFSKDNLQLLIPNKKTRILIYCNNNFFTEPNEKDLMLKSASLALNIPTFINLHGYGYKNIYELKDVVPVDPKVIPLAGKRLAKKK